MGKLPWNELVPTISIAPEAADRDDVARLASELMEARRFIYLVKTHWSEFGYKLESEHYTVTYPRTIHLELQGIAESLESGPDGQS